MHRCQWLGWSMWLVCDGLHALWKEFPQFALPFPFTGVPLPCKAESCRQCKGQHIWTYGFWEGTATAGISPRAGVPLGSIAIFSCRLLTVLEVVQQLPQVSPSLGSIRDSILRQGISLREGRNPSTRFNACLLGERFRHRSALCMILHVDLPWSR